MPLAVSGRIPFRTGGREIHGVPPTSFAGGMNGKAVPRHVQGQRQQPAAARTKGKDKGRLHGGGLHLGQAITPRQ